ncbi:hypothetical protein LMG28614_00105 [Paraburkholderia ultramafica]|uniref:FecR protein domain-containing protein n=1 Tax=Paraburkholderia ultramafica TaxID=1544867 RepID=A0A6S7AS02_9BURK|nr:hypothetical protein [Paraburkholderia ultramafica]CAB3775897.1 hypothetical protein LMG28614_00105 [Paraburkholderia ultramafica]
MTRSVKPDRTLFRAPLRLVPLVLLAIASYAHAGWTLARADTPVTTIHATSVYQAEAGQRLVQDDIVQTPSSGVVQIQDESGNIVAFGHDTRVLLMRDAHVALLRGWVKVLNACSVANCVPPVVDTERTRFTLADRTALVIAAAPPGYDSADAVYCESGSAQLLALGKSRSKPVDVRIDAHQFALRAKTNEAISIYASPDSKFVATMPITFRDALRTLPSPANPRNLPTHDLRPVTYDDVSDWLGSALAVRTDPATRFTGRFRARLSDPAFRRDVRQHVRELPDWRPLVFPQPRLTPRAAILAVPSAYPSISARP